MAAIVNAILITPALYRVGKLGPLPCPPLKKTSKSRDCQLYFWRLRRMNPNPVTTDAPPSTQFSQWPWFLLPTFEWRRSASAVLLHVSRQADPLGNDEQRLAHRATESRDRGLSVSRPPAHLGVVASAGGNVDRRAEGPWRMEVPRHGRSLCEVCNRTPSDRGSQD